jgi:hypothetical protein
MQMDAVLFPGLFDLPWWELVPARGDERDQGFGRVLAALALLRVNRSLRNRHEERAAFSGFTLPSAFCLLTLGIVGSVPAINLRAFC